MLKLLLDEHISPQVARGINRISKEVSVVPTVDWEQGRFLGVGDELILEQAARQALTLVTYDRKTIPVILKLWAEIGRHHAGIIFVDEKSIPPSDFGGLIRALITVHHDQARMDWAGRVSFLRRQI